MSEASPRFAGRIQRADLIAIAVLLGLTAIAAWNRFVYDAWLTRHDLLTFFLPWMGYLGERLRDFDIPGWDPYLFSGHPFAGDPESGWMFLPAMLAFPFFGAITALKVMIVLQLIVAGTTTYWLGRLLGLGAVASLIAAVIFEFGQFLQYVTYCCTVRGFVAMWLPLALIGVELAFRATRWRDRVAPWFLTGFAISQMFAGWMGQGVVVALLVIAAWVGYRSLLSPPQGGWDVQTRLVQGVTTGVATVVLGVALGAAGIFLRLNVNAQTNLAGGDYERLGQPHAANPLTIEPLILYIFGSGYTSRAVALGGAALVLTMIAPFLAGRCFGIPYFLGLTLVVYTLMLDTTPLHELFYLIPRFQTLHEHSPHQISTVVAIGPAMLSGAAVEAIRRWRGRWWVLALLIVPMAVIVLVGRWLSDIGRWLGWEVYIAAALVTALLILAIALPVLWRNAAVLRLANLLPALILVVAFLQPTGVEIAGSISGNPPDETYRQFFRPD
ncbi:MAG: hypothetical protein H0W06_09565, partial [Chloroflexia bacterium]|nr:hypothetical protein [Chloroflexia bacterium]